MADDDATTDADGGTTGPPDKKDTPAQKKQVKNEHVLIAVGVVTLIVTLMYLRKGSKSSGSGQSVANSPYGVNAGSNQDPYGYGSEINTLANDLQSMQSEIVGLSAPGPSSGSTTPAPWTQPSGESLSGSGYWFAPGSKNANAPIVDSTGSSFSWIGPAQFSALASGGQPVYYQPQPGTFLPWEGSTQLATGTPLFEKTS